MNFLKSAPLKVRLVCSSVCMIAAYSTVFLSHMCRITFISQNDTVQCDSSEFGLFVAMNYQLDTDCLLSEILEMQSRYGLLKPASDGSITSSRTTYADSNRAVESRVKTISNGKLAGSKAVKGVVSNNFYVDARKCGISPVIIDRVINSLSANINFRRSIKAGDQFEVVYRGNELMYARIIAKASSVAAYKFEGTYYFENGNKIVASNRSNTFGSPLNGPLKISSGFGWRVHPISRRYERHTGVDLCANHGTPVYAIQEGVVTRASRYYGYGHCIDIRHTSGYSSRYGHLSGYTVKAGARVKKGQIIGRVGSSGYSTGSHLHIELAHYSKKLNPLHVKMIPLEVSADRVKNMYQFNAHKKYIRSVVS